LLQDVEKKTLIGLSLRSASVGPKDEDESGDGGSKNDVPNGSASASQPGAAKTDVQRLQCFIFEQFENVYHFLSQCFVSFGHEIYCQPNIAEAVSSTVLQVSIALKPYKLPCNWKVRRCRSSQLIGWWKRRIIGKNGGPRRWRSTRGY
jgi:hypothetical protein